MSIAWLARNSGKLVNSHKPRRPYFRIAIAWTIAHGTRSAALLYTNAAVVGVNGNTVHRVESEASLSAEIRKVVG